MCDCVGDGCDMGSGVYREGGFLGENMCVVGGVTGILVILSSIYRGLRDRSLFFRRGAVATSKTPHKNT